MHHFFYRQPALVGFKITVVSLAFSFDGSSVARGSSRGECCRVNLAPGSQHQNLTCSRPSPSVDTDNVNDGDDPYWGGPQTPPQARDTIAAFNPSIRSACLATYRVGRGGINAVDVETGSVVAYMGGKMFELMHMRDVSLSRPTANSSSECRQWA
uniref:Uncharacterized protein n=1 Tax=Ganoderma boninense TaxID=34458 RepID=A0A5K1JUW3_9APHY|nr:Uncharacterized protein [Ganoderma boninense]